MDDELSTIQRQIAELQEKERTMIHVKRESAISQIKALMTQYGVKAADLTASRGAGKKQNGTKAAAIQYRDDASGNTWTGRGRQPKWMEGKDRETFRVAPAGASA